MTVVLPSFFYIVFHQYILRTFIDFEIISKVVQFENNMILLLLRKLCERMRVVSFLKVFNLYEINIHCIIINIYFVFVQTNIYSVFLGNTKTLVIGY